MNEEKQRLKSILISEHCDEGQVLTMLPAIDAGLTADDVINVKAKSGKITQSNSREREGVLISVVKKLAERK